MVGDALARNFASRFGLGDDRCKIPPLVVPEQMLEVAREPVLDAAVGLLGVGLKGGGEGLDEFVIHVSRISVTLSAMVASSSRAGALSVFLS